MAAVGFLSEFSIFVNQVLITKVDGVIAQFISAKIAPAVILSAALAVIFWAVKVVRGHVQGLLIDSALRLLTIIAIVAVCVNLWMWNEVFANVLLNGFGYLAAGITGSANPVLMADDVWTDINVVAESLAHRGGWSSPFLSFMSAIVYVFGGLTSLVLCAMWNVSSMLVHAIVNLGPLFVWGLMFQTTNKYFENFIGQIVTWALVPLIAAIIGAIGLTFVRHYSTVAAGNPDVEVSEAWQVIGACIIVFITMLMAGIAAAGLGSGIGLGSSGLMAATGRYVFNTTRSTAYLGARGFADGVRNMKQSQYAPLRRNAANSLGRLVRSGAQHALPSSFVGSGGAVRRRSS